MNREAYIFDAIRTPRGRGKANGALHEVRPIALVAGLLKALARRHKLPTAEVEDVILGCVTPIGEQGADIARTAVLYAGWDQKVPGFQLSRFCASGLEAVNLAAMKVRSGWESLLVAGGIESMSRVPMGSDGGAWLMDPDVNRKLGFVPQGISADLIATREGYRREAVDRFALRSQQRALHAWENGFFNRSVIPVEDQNGMMILEKDEHLRPETTLEGLGNLKPAFAKVGEMGYDHVAIDRYPEVESIDHVHTAGNSSGIVDGAALVLLGAKEKGEALGLRPRARIVAAAVSSSEPTIMLEGPIPASEKALKMAGMTIKDLDLFEMNEAFAAAAMRVQQHFNVPDDRYNVNGGAIAMGHPLGATGAMLIGTVLDELERRDGHLGLVTLCIGGGMGVSTIIERV